VPGFGLRRRRALFFTRRQLRSIHTVPPYQCRCPTLSRPPAGRVHRDAAFFPDHGRRISASATLSRAGGRPAHRGGSATRRSIGHLGRLLLDCHQTRGTPRRPRSNLGATGSGVVVTPTAARPATVFRRHCSQFSASGPRAHASAVWVDGEPPRPASCCAFANHPGGRRPWADPLDAAKPELVAEGRLRPPTARLSAVPGASRPTCPCGNPLATRITAKKKKKKKYKKSHSRPSLCRRGSKPILPCPRPESSCCAGKSLNCPNTWDAGKRDRRPHQTFLFPPSATTRNA